LNRWAVVIALAVGGALGTNARHWLGVWVREWAGTRFPWGTFLINVSGSFAIGFLAISLDRWVRTPELRLMVITGFLGGYTTFSAYSLETLLLWERGEPIRALAYLGGSALAGLAAVMLGVVLGRQWS